MRKPEQAPEPSIEEILASIRRIIADDAPPAAAAPEEPTRLQVHSGTPRPRAEGRREDEVLELTEDYMLAEEAAAGRLREPAEPGDFMSDRGYDSSHGDPFAQDNERFNGTRHSDPYADLGTMSAPQTVEAEAAAEPEAPANSTTNGLASVMAEVQRFVDVGNAPAPVSEEREQEPEPETEAPKSTVRPLENWTQPANEVFKSDPAPRPPSRWSARQKSADATKAPEPVAARPAPAARDQAPQRKPGLGSRDWAQGVQMPVPDEGPGIPFAEEALDQPAPPPPMATPEWSTPGPLAGATAAPEAATPLPFELLRTPTAEPADAPQPAIPLDVQARAEKLAERAVADFANDKLEALPVTDFLKSDKPLMEAITGSLATALAKAGDAAAEAEEPTTLLMDALAADTPAPDLSAPRPVDEPMVLDLPHEIPNLDGGFMAPPSLASQPSAAAPPASQPAPSQPPARMTTASVVPDQDSLELPREDIDDMVPGDMSAIPHPEHIMGAASYKPTGIAEQPTMQQVPAAVPGRMMSRPASPAGAADFEALGAVSPGAPRTLEDTVRDMLRPLLAQWLSENMPRIVNDAIREEMAAMGMKLPRRE